MCRQWLTGIVTLYVVHTTCQYTLNLRDIYVALTLKGLYKVRAVRRTNAGLNEIRNMLFQKANCVLILVIRHTVCTISSFRSSLVSVCLLTYSNRV